METHDTTFYHDHGISGVKMENQVVSQLKRKMTLDFDSSSPKSKQLKMGNLLQSPDLNMLKLASPELEKMIIQANGMVTTTPTPTQFLFPKYVTDEQEAYARGFVEALAQLHGTNPEDENDFDHDDDLSGSESDTSSLSSVSKGTYALPTTSTLTSLSTTTTLPGGIVQINHKPGSQASGGINNRFRTKDESQIVPSFGSSPPLSPINMESQERIKLERKRARNRVAARKCRTRKLERISRLEDRVSDLKGQNTDLATTATSLRDQVCKLKQQIIEHVSSGCQIMMTNSLNF
ncbi:transcription factor AP-1-like [Mizuhopecten yessoensis]|uniref:Transcription factor AP-1 n=1 Tax=Mizuhopecten yessoensis TaxID=6573 RepID=A0A210PVV5_MIZYE|nr:transcription factor AP-1-like [Mizuhopecten yessoensis]OWF40627.1 Transcription factor AP-1 [Mizuhopecten yessoensis]